MPGDIDVRRDREEVRVHRGHVRGEADAQLGAVGGQGPRNRARDEDAEQAAHGLGNSAYFAASGPMTRSICAKIFGLPQTMRPESRKPESPRKSPTRPPASCTSSAPAAMSQGERPISQNPSSLPAAT